MNKIRLNIVGIFSNNPSEANCTLVLGETAGYRKIPIMIGILEAQSIALALEGNKLDRPIMHDLFKELILQMKYTVKEVTITTLKEGVFFAQIVITNQQELITLDARPSDAIAIGLRFNAPLFIDEALLNRMDGVLISTAKGLADEHVESDILYKAYKIDKKLDIKDKSVAVLKELLLRMIKDENYEQAASIRDELKRRSN